MRPEAKVKARRRHEIGIAMFRAWLEANPNAKRRERFQTFDLMIDTNRLLPKKKRIKIEHSSRT